MYAITEGIFQPGDVKLFIELGALDGGGAHPQAAGPTLSVLGPPQCENVRFEQNSGKLKGLGRRIAPWCTLRYGTGNTQQHPLASSVPDLLNRGYVPSTTITDAFVVACTTDDEEKAQQTMRTLGPHHPFSHLIRISSSSFPLGFSSTSTFVKERSAIL
ncbi:hypothetical protein C8R48DRAFT_770134 [Suillus tomentosus]|nr:hypothetical protein C8R48DRAFT_770134 [Suillus tomentosus]